MDALKKPNEIFLKFRNLNNISSQKRIGVNRYAPTA